MMFARVRGHFGKWEGQFEGAADKLGSATTKVTIDAASIDTGIAGTGTPHRLACGCGEDAGALGCGQAVAETAAEAVGDCGPPATCTHARMRGS